MAHALRVPKLDLTSILAQQNPHVDLRIEAYETSTRNFLKAVSRYTQNAQAEITRRKTTHVNEKNRIAERIQHVENETNTCKLKELELIAGKRCRLSRRETTLTKYKSWRKNGRRGRKQSYLSPPSRDNYHPSKSNVLYWTWR